MESMVVRNKKHGKITFFVEKNRLKANINNETGDVWMYGRQLERVWVQPNDNLETIVRKVSGKLNSDYATVMRELI